MIRNVSQLELKIEDRTYRLNCEIDSPLSHVKEALLKFIQHIGQIEDQINAKKKEEEAKALEEQPKEG